MVERVNYRAGKEWLTGCVGIDRVDNCVLE